MLNKGMIQPTEGAGLSGIINKSGKQAASGGIFSKLLAILEQHGKTAAKTSVFAQAKNNSQKQSEATKQDGLSIQQNILPTTGKQQLARNTALLHTETTGKTTARIPGHNLSVNLTHQQEKEKKQAKSGENSQQAIATVPSTILKQPDITPVQAAIRKTATEQSDKESIWRTGKRNIATTKQTLGQGDLAKSQQPFATLSPHSNGSDLKNISTLNTGFVTQANKTEHTLLSNTVKDSAGGKNTTTASITTSSLSTNASSSLAEAHPSASSGQHIADDKQTSATALKHKADVSTDKLLSRQETEHSNPTRANSKTAYTPVTKSPDNAIQATAMAAAQNSSPQHAVIQNNAIQNNTLNNTPHTASSQSASAIAASLNQQTGEFSQGDTSGQQSSDRGNQDAKTFSISADQRSNTHTAATSTSFSSYLSHKAEASMGLFDSMQFIAQSAKNGKTKLEIQLEPANLGKIHVSLQTDAAKQLQVHLIVDQNSTRQAIEQQMPALRHALAQQGLDLSGFSMSSQDQGSSFDQQFEAQHHHAPMAMSNDNLSTAEPLTTSPPNQNNRDALGGLSIRI